MREKIDQKEKNTEKIIINIQKKKEEELAKETEDRIKKKDKMDKNILEQMEKLEQNNKKFFEKQEKIEQNILIKSVEKRQFNKKRKMMIMKKKEKKKIKIKKL